MIHGHLEPLAIAAAGSASGLAAYLSMPSKKNL
jgi:hypothetical protein